MPTLSTRVFNAIVRLRGKRVDRQVKRMIGDLKASQQALLLSIIKKNQATEFGAKHRFVQIRSVQDFRDRVSVCEYETLRPFIERQDASGEAALLSEKPIFYAVTSGTTGKPKYIPLHKSALKSHSDSTNLYLGRFLSERPEMFAGKIMAIVSPAVEGQMEASGLPFGSTSGHMYESIPSLVKRKYLIPSCVFAIPDYDLKYRAILRLALQEKNITYLTTANPSTIAKLVSLLPKNLVQMADEIERGEFSGLSEMDAACAENVRQRLEPNPARASELRKLIQSGEKIRFRDLWPNLQAVATWTGGSSSIFLDQLKGQFPEQTLIRDLGYLASEFRGNVPILSGTNAGLPTFWSTFYEFVEQSEWDDGGKTFLGLHELENGKRYYIFVTTDYGLYRYHMNDIIQVDGFYRGCPLIRFSQKGKGVTSITGEKLYESQVLAAVSQAEKEFKVDSEFFVMSCSPEDAQYTLYYELAPTVKEDFLKRVGIQSFEVCKQYEARLDEVLGEINIEYLAKRKSGRIKPLRLCVLKRGAYDAFKRFYLKAGQREGQFKIIALQFAKDLKFDFAPQTGWDGGLDDDRNLEILAATRHAWVVNEAIRKVDSNSEARTERPVVSLQESVSL